MSNYCLSDPVNYISYRDLFLKKNNTFFIDPRSQVILRIFFTRPTWRDTQLITTAQRLNWLETKNVLYRLKEGGLEEAYVMGDNIHISGALMHTDILLHLNGISRFFNRTFTLYETALLTLIEKVQMDVTFLEVLLTHDKHLIGNILVQDYDLVLESEKCLIDKPFPFFYRDLEPGFEIANNRISERYLLRGLIPPTLLPTSKYKLLQNFQLLESQSLQFNNCFLQICNENPYVLGSDGQSYFVYALPWI